MTATMLGCPHCRKPIGSVPRIAGQPVSCPYCRRPFQMPGMPESPAKPAPRVKEEAPPTQKDKPEPTPSEPKVRVVMDSYRVANVLANRFVVLGSAAILLAAGLVALEVVVPLFSPTNNRPADFGVGIVGSLLVVACSTVGITTLLLLRALIRVGVDTARAIRSPDPEAAAELKPK